MVISNHSAGLGRACESEFSGRAMSDIIQSVSEK
jgi:hypothetical protein